MRPIKAGFVLAALGAALVLIAGARKPCVVPELATEEIGEADFKDEATASRELWRARKDLWRDRHGERPRRKPAVSQDEEAGEEAGEEPQVPRSEGGARIEDDVVITADGAETMTTLPRDFTRLA